MQGFDIPSDDGSLRLTFEYKSDPSAAREARRNVRSVLKLWELAVLVDTCQLLVSELVTNAFQHAHGELVSMSIVRCGSRVRLEVADGNEDAPNVRPADIDDEDGRGLLLVSALSADWGVERVPNGKRVWCEVDPAAVT